MTEEAAGIGARDLARLIEQNTGQDGLYNTAIPRLFLMRASQPSEAMYGMYEPALCIVAQGRKRAMVGESIYSYDRSHCLIGAVEVPAIGQVIDASPEKPYLCLKLDLDPKLIGELIVEAKLPALNDDHPGPALTVSKITPELLDAATRLVQLLNAPRDIPILAPLIEREIVYRLLLGDQISRLRHIAFADSKVQQVNRAIGWIKKHFREPFSIDAVAAEAKMSASTLHEHFKTVTSMSPLQYQKQLRLQEARRLIVSQSVDAATAAYAVGYESASQFSREYKRNFGAPPARDAARLRGLSSVPEGI